MEVFVFILALTARMLGELLETQILQQLYMYYLPPNPICQTEFYHFQGPKCHWKMLPKCFLSNYISYN